jgi:hypothetical protein
MWESLNNYWSSLRTAALSLSRDFSLPLIILGRFLWKLHFRQRWQVTYCWAGVAKWRSGFMNIRKVSCCYFLHLFSSLSFGVMVFLIFFSVWPRHAFFFFIGLVELTYWIDVPARYWVRRKPRLIISYDAEILTPDRKLVFVSFEFGF